MRKTLTIVLTGGGSGGHITPLLSLAHALKKAAPECRIVYIGLEGDALENSLQKRFQIFDEVRFVPSGKFRRYHGESLLAHLVDVRTLALNFRDLARVLKGIFTARRILKRVKPDIVFSKGGFVVVPVGIAARMQRIPIVTHDSDAVPGLANRVVGRFAKIHATGMPASQYNYPAETIHYVGIPLDERIRPMTPQLQKSYKKDLGWPTDSLVLLVGGAGLGARDVNNTIIEIAPDLFIRFPGLYICHITGVKHQPEVAAKYKEVLPGQSDRLQVLGFTPEFYKYSGAADLIVTRAGATTIAELAAQRKAVILIPAPHLTGGHQLKNAEQLRKLAAVEVVPNKDSAKLLAALADLLSDRNKRQKLADKLGSLAKPDAADRLAELLLTAASGNISE